MHLTAIALQMSRCTVFDIVKQCSKLGGNIYELSGGAVQALEVVGVVSIPMITLYLQRICLSGPIRKLCDK